MTLNNLGAPSTRRDGAAGVSHARRFPTSSLGAQIGSERGVSADQLHRERSVNHSDGVGVAVASQVVGSYPLNLGGSVPRKDAEPSRPGAAGLVQHYQVERLSDGS